MAVAYSKPVLHARLKRTSNWQAMPLHQVLGINPDTLTKRDPFILEEPMPKDLNNKAVLVKIPEKSLIAIDNLAQAEGRTRSELIREALRRYIKYADRERHVE